MVSLKLPRCVVVVALDPIDLIDSGDDILVAWNDQARYLPSRACAC